MEGSPKSGRASGLLAYTSDELALFPRLALLQRRSVQGSLPGGRRSIRHSRSAEFADFRPYVPGDDFRQIDWKVYARLERLMLRLYVAEEESSVTILVDASASMALGNPPKWPAARRLAGALGLIALAGMDRVAVAVLSDPSKRTSYLRGGPAGSRLIGFLSELEPQGNFTPAAIRPISWMRSGILIIVSDFLSDQSWERPLSAIASRRRQPLLWQVLAPDEENPTLAGDLKLVDAESPLRQEMTITPRIVDEYVARLAAHRQALRKAASATGGQFFNTSSAEDLQTGLGAAISAGILGRSR